MAAALISSLDAVGGRLLMSFTADWTTLTSVQNAAAASGDVVGAVQETTAMYIPTVRAMTPSCRCIALSYPLVYAVIAGDPAPLIGRNSPFSSLVTPTGAELDRVRQRPRGCPKYATPRHRRRGMNEKPSIRSARRIAFESSTTVPNSGRTGSGVQSPPPPVAPPTRSVSRQPLRRLVSRLPS